MFARPISYSQLGEDIWIYRNFLNQPVRDAVLVEIGAYNGLHYSNTLLLEHLTQAHVVLVEPARATYDECRTNRPNARVYGCAVADQFGALELMGESAVAGIRQHLSSGYIQQWDMDQAKVQQVVAMPFWALEQMERLPFIDVLSIDVQGSELAVLQGIDWSIPIGCVCLELEEQDLDRDRKCRKVLEDHGYLLRVRLGVSEIWTNPKYERNEILFRTKAVTPAGRFLTPYLEPAWSNQIMAILSDSALAPVP